MHTRGDQSALAQPDGRVVAALQGRGSSRSALCCFRTAAGSSTRDVVHGFHEGLARARFPSPSLAGCRHPLNLARVSRRHRMAVTAACMLTPRQLFLEIGGFDETRFPVSYNDADYGYRLVDAGYRCVYCAEAEALSSRRAFPRPGERPPRAGYVPAGTWPSNRSLFQPAPRPRDRDFRDQTDGRTGRHPSRPDSGAGVHSQSKLGRSTPVRARAFEPAQGLRDDRSLGPQPE